MLFSVLPAHAAAQQEASDAEAEVDVRVLEKEPDEEALPFGKTITAADLLEDMPTDDELFAEYVQQVFYPELAVATYADYARRVLNTAEYAVYTKLKEEIAKIAAGERASTVIYLKIDLPVEQIRKLDLETVYYCLLFDCPYELYWHNKTIGCGVPDEITTDELFFAFTVAQAYAASGSSYKADTAKTQSTTAAKANADQIVQQCAALNDREKLTAYKDAICERTSYNRAAANTMSDKTAYGDPWQMIYVFDGDPSTNVVCEGYSKAFQYLCDRSTFTGTVQCYTVTGTINGGAHMWNIVTLDGTNYLVDVTNSDEG
jgi:hypothetical protein